jgi:methylmalonyl-CoA mutase, C-terminal domain
VPHWLSRRVSTIVQSLPPQIQLQICRSSLTKKLNDRFSRTNVTLKGGQKRPIRVLVSNLRLDGHDRGVVVICRALRDAGIEVIYSGLFCTPEQVAKIAIDEDVDVVAMSLLNGAHLRLFPKVRSLLNKQGAKNIVAIGGGITPKKIRSWRNTAFRETLVLVLP